MRWRCASLTASSALLLLAGCGGGDRATPPPKPPGIPAGVAARLAAEADAVARLPAGSCAARDAAVRFRADAIASVGSLPSRYQEPLLSAANDLAQRTASCSEPAPRRKKKGDEDHGKKRGHDKHEDEQ
jgi:hypothetical protein